MDNNEAEADALDNAMEEEDVQARYDRGGDALQALTIRLIADSALKAKFIAALRPNDEDTQLMIFRVACDPAKAVGAMDERSPNAVAMTGVTSGAARMYDYLTNATVREAEAVIASIAPKESTGNGS